MLSHPCGGCDAEASEKGTLLIDRLADRCCYRMSAAVAERRQPGREFGSVWNPRRGLHARGLHSSCTTGYYCCGWLGTAEAQREENGVGIVGSRPWVWNGVMAKRVKRQLTSATMGRLSRTGLPAIQRAPNAQEIYGDIYIYTCPVCVSPPSLSLTATIDDPSLMLLAVFPSPAPMTVPRGNHLKRPRGSFTRHHKRDQHPREHAEERNPPIIAPTDTRSTRVSNCQPQSRSVSNRRRKRRRFSANCAGALQNHLPIASHTKPVFPTPSSSTASSAPPSSSHPDEEDRLSVISERLRLKMSISSSTTAHGRRPTGQVCTYEDWQDIKELFAKAAEQYNGEHVPNVCPSDFSLQAYATQTLMHCVKSPRNGRRRGNAVTARCNSRMSQVPVILP